MGTENIIILIVGAVLFIYGAVLRPVGAYLSDRENTGTTNTVFAVAGLALLFVSQSFVIIPTGFTGIKTTFGQIDQNTLPNGFNFKIPFVQDITKVNNKFQETSFKKEQVASETKERNTVTFSNISVTYKLVADKSAWVYANYSDTENLVDFKIVSDAIKSASKTLSPADVTNREILNPKVLETLQGSLDGKYGQGTVVLNKVIVENAAFDKEYDKRIAEKQQAQMEYETQQIMNKKNIEKAESDALVKKTNAEAEAKANRQISDSVTSQLVDYETAQARKQHGWVTVQGAGTVVTKE